MSWSELGSFYYKEYLNNLYDCKDLKLWERFDST